MVTAYMKYLEENNNNNYSDFNHELGGFGCICFNMNVQHFMKF